MTSTSPADPAHLFSLVDLISNAVKVVAKEYAAVGETVPSLDSTAPGPFDTPESVPPALRNAVEIIEAACAQLTFSVASPGHSVVNVSFLLCLP